MYLTQQRSTTSDSGHDTLTSTRSNATSGGGRSKQHKRPPNSGSALLTDAENIHLYSILGPERVSLAAGVAQLLQGCGQAWKKVHVGVAMLVKDYERRHYAIYMLDVYGGGQQWAQAL